ncbi:hypothetical protein [Bifidobacterium stellenboschense]|uniref:Uncharacterized protein n=1 Tax=Bifidobacterium stellenboschense TaxID=762211 RepID=A0A087DZE6_9BIFI|nr:hypothetical protein [Bifidobacterium stellenboschense]KFJ00897.1 hypothetical protein BSTEL_0309 [Bifidobacterium stellenboschense]
MKHNSELDNQIKLFFGFDEDSVSRKEYQTMEEHTACLVDEYGWDAVRQAFFRYVQAECKTSDDIARVGFRYEFLGWNKKAIPDPYEFLGYLYYKAGFRKASPDAAHALDDLCITVLPASGYPEANIYYHPYYAAEADPKMIDAVERWRQRETGEETPK